MYYNIEDIKIIPYVRFQAPDGVLHDTMDKALAHRPPHCKPGQYAMWGRSEEEYFLTVEHGEAILLFISNDVAVSNFEEDCGFFGGFQRWRVWPRLVCLGPFRKYLVVHPRLHWRKPCAEIIKEENESSPFAN